MTSITGAHDDGTHIALFMSLLTGGGVQRCMLNLAGELARYGHRVDLLICRANTREPGKVVPTGVRLVTLKPAPSVWGRFSALKADPEGIGALLRPVLLPLKSASKLRYLADLACYLRRERPQALLSAMTQPNLVALWARRLADVSTRMVITEHNMLSSRAEHLGHTWRWRYLPPLIRRTYSFADAIVAVSQAVADDLATTADIPGKRIIPIPNPTVTPALLEQARSRPRHPWFAPGAPPVVLGVGRLVEHKDFATLLRAFARVRETRPARLMILGEGPERSALQRLSAELGITDAVAMPGWVDNPIAHMAGAGVLVLSSHWEGLPGVLIEALASGCPVVATDAPGGAAEILDHGAYGKLVRIADVPAMAAAILETLARPPDGERLKARGEEFSVERSARRYQDVLCAP
ncbi:MAG: glycosyltransferase [Nitrococcus sp.]|nr:glycosyltransferase [Nitrococcus sp.]